MKYLVLSLSLILLACGRQVAVDEADTEDIVVEEVYAEGESAAPAEEDAAVDAAVEVTQEDIKAFAQKVKKNVKAGKWEDIAWYDGEEYGECAVKVTNKNSFPIDGSDYYITYKYEYLYGDGVMPPENNKKNGKTLPAGGFQKFTHHYTDDCSPTWVTVHFTLSDQQIYDKYAGL